jgi:hypothetical protein
MAEGNVHSVTVEGTTELLPFEADAPSSDAWARALTHAAARGRTLATALGDELGQVLAVEERPGQRETAELRLAVTYALGSGGVEQIAIGHQRALPADEVMDYVDDTVRPAYAAFRQQLLASEPALRSSPAPLRNGKRRYEGFGRGGRNVIYAGFRRGRVKLQLELPREHDVPPEEVIRHGKREFRIVMLTSTTQVGGAIELARETLGSITD